MTASALKGRECIVLTAVYNDWPSAAQLIATLDHIFSDLGLSGRIVVVDDASTDDNGEDEIGSLALAAIASIDVIRLASNQGNQRALAVGMGYIASHLSCDYLLVMDSDFEDKPEDIPALLEACRSGDGSRVIFAERSKRSEGQTFTAFYLLYKCLNRMLTGRTISFGNFSAIPGRLVRRLAHISQLWNHFPASIIRAGVPFGTIPSERGARRLGHGKMNMVKLVVHAFSSFAVYADLMAVRIMIFALLVGLGFVLAFIVASVLRVSTDLLIPGWTSQVLMQALLLFAIALGTAMIVLFTALALRTQPQLIPFHDHARFIFEVVRLYPSADRRRTAEPPPIPRDAAVNR